MKAAFLVDQNNFRTYCESVPEGWDVRHFGNDRYDAKELIASGAEAILCDPMIDVPAEVIRAMPDLKIIHSFGVGFNRIDLAAATEKGIYVCNNAGVNAGAVAEQTVLLMLAALRKYHEGEWMTYAARQGEFKKRCFNRGLTELSECRVGLIGLGAIGSETAKRLKGFGCEVFYYKRHHPVKDEAELGVTYADQDWILENCDIISLHVPVTEETKNLICDETLKKMKPGAILVNTSRGELVDQEAVVRSLKDGTLGYFAADTLAPEPVQKDNPIIGVPEELKDRMALSPHIGGITSGTFKRSYKKAFANIALAVSGKRPGDIVNGL